MTSNSGQRNRILDSDDSVWRHKNYLVLICSTLPSDLYLKALHSKEMCLKHTKQMTYELSWSSNSILNPLVLGHFSGTGNWPLCLNNAEKKTFWHTSSSIVRQGKKGGRSYIIFHKFCSKATNAAVIFNYMKLCGRDAYLLIWQGHRLLRNNGRLLISAKSSTDFPNIWKGIQTNSYSYLLDGIHWQTDSQHQGWGAMMK